VAVIVISVVRFGSRAALNADLARRQLVVVERHGQSQIIRFCANVTAGSNRSPACAFTDIRLFAVEGVGLVGASVAG
jgi:hypothetical protein